ncbi:hypothetical protein [Microbispora sp. ATCC PTA-5024]|uniref:hypothetical protein n=1 Tax=Microbispora sp. ATCC PTA-5024 TaxID=316330 RepID=UPI0012EECF84|nr:hypothetical protein [Microbispora sp. ATCC PTA-5024]
MDERLLKALLEDLARAVDDWTATASTILTDPEADLSWAGDESTLGRVRGALSALDRNDVTAAVFELMQGLMAIKPSRRKATCDHAQPYSGCPVPNLVMACPSTPE